MNHSIPEVQPLEGKNTDEQVFIDELTQESSHSESSDEEEIKISTEIDSDDRGNLLAASKTFEAPNQLLLLEGTKTQPKRKLSRKETLRNKSFEEEVEFAEPNFITPG